jgi:hypothetical protein
MIIPSQKRVVIVDAQIHWILFIHGGMAHYELMLRTTNKQFYIQPDCVENKAIGWVQSAVRICIQLMLGGDQPALVMHYAPISNERASHHYTTSLFVS